MATQTIAYGTRTALTITLASLATATFRQSTEIDNSSDLAVDAVLHGKITTGTTPTADKSITIYVWGSDGTGARPANAGASDAAVTPSSEEAQLEVARVIPTDSTSNHEYNFYVGSVAALFGGVLPKKWGVIVTHDTAVNLNSTGGNHEIYYTPIKFAIA